jgi:hypothetical protein
VCWLFVIVYELSPNLLALNVYYLNVSLVQKFQAVCLGSSGSRYLCPGICGSRSLMRLQWRQWLRLSASDGRTHSQDGSFNVAIDRRPQLPDPGMWALPKDCLSLLMIWQLTLTGNDDTERERERERKGGRRRKDLHQSEMFYLCQYTCHILMYFPFCFLAVTASVHMGCPIYLFACLFVFIL